MNYNIRLCIIKKWPGTNGYGFNLHGEKNKTGQFIGKIELDSPAESGGLLEHDRVIQVNGVDVTNEFHPQVCKRIVERENEVALLVIDTKGFQYCEENNMQISEYVDGVRRIECADVAGQPATVTMLNEEERARGGRDGGGGGGSGAIGEQDAEASHEPITTSGGGCDVSPANEVNGTTGGSGGEETKQSAAPFEIELQVAGGRRKRNQQLEGTSFKDRAKLFDSLK